MRMWRKFFSLKKNFALQIKLPIGVLTTLLCFSASAQSSNNLYWVRYFNQFHFNTKWSWQNEIDERRSIQPDHQRQFIMHSYANFKPNSKNDIATGITGSWVTNTKNLTVPEIRFFQSATSKIATIGKIDLHVRFRLEERFFHNTDGEKINLTDGYHFKFRTRYRIQFQKNLDTDKKWSARLSDEIMYHTDSDDLWKFDQNRIYVALERKLTKQLSLEMGYLLLHALSNEKIVYSNNLRTTLYHRISL